jgi:hypothetical protein
VDPSEERVKVYVVSLKDILVSVRFRNPQRFISRASWVLPEIVPEVDRVPLTVSGPVFAAPVTPRVPVTDAFCVMVTFALSDNVWFSGAAAITP